MKYFTTLALVLAYSMPGMAQNKDAELRIQIESPPANTQIAQIGEIRGWATHPTDCLLYTSPSPRDLSTSRMPSSA